MSEKLVQVPIDELLTYPPINLSALNTAEGDSLISHPNTSPTIKIHGDTRLLAISPQKDPYEISGVLYFADGTKISCESGKGTIIVQKFESDESGRLDPNEIIEYKPINRGSTETIQGGCFVWIVNTGKIDLVITDHSPQRTGLQLHQLPELEISSSIKEKGCPVSVDVRKEQPIFSLKRKSSFLPPKHK